MPVKPFLDTHLWVYAYLNNPPDDRCAQAWTLVNQLSRPVSTRRFTAHIQPDHPQCRVRSFRNDDPTV